MSRQEKEEKQDKELHIELKEDIRRVVEKYCHEAGLEPESVAFAMGYISGAVDDDDIAIQQLTHLLQAYFFAGVFYSRSYEFDYDYLTPEERSDKSKKKAEERKKKLDKQASVRRPGYVG